MVGLYNFTQETILRYGLAFVAVWFGVNEILYPDMWVGFIPQFLMIEGMSTTLIMAHGILLTLCGVLLVVNYYRAVASAILALMLAQIVAHLLWIGAYDIAVRDAGLLAMAIALAMSVGEEVEKVSQK